MVNLIPFDNYLQILSSSSLTSTQIYTKEPSLKAASGLGVISRVEHPLKEQSPTWRCQQLQIDPRLMAEAPEGSTLVTFGSGRSRREESSQKTCA